MSEMPERPFGDGSWVSLRAIARQGITAASAGLRNMICDAIKDGSLKIPVMSILKDMELPPIGDGLNISFMPFGMLAEMWILPERPYTAAILVLGECFLAEKRAFILKRIDKE